MTKDCSISSDDLRHSRQRPGRPWRPWLWGLTSWLRNGGILAAFYLALQTGVAGALALAAFIGGFLLRQVLEATSQGD